MDLIPFQIPRKTGDFLFLTGTVLAIFFLKAMHPETQNHSYEKTDAWSFTLRWY